MRMQTVGRIQANSNLTAVKPASAFAKAFDLSNHSQRNWRLSFETTSARRRLLTAVNLGVRHRTGRIGRFVARTGDGCAMPMAELCGKQSFDATHGDDEVAPGADVIALRVWGRAAP